MLVSILLGCVLVVATTGIHATFMVLALRTVRGRGLSGRDQVSHWRAATVVGLFVLVMFLAGIAETLLWVLLYRALGIFGSWEEALYFSTVTYTSLGYGDITLDAPWRLLAAFQAANGVIMFGWTTGLVFAVVQWVYAKVPHVHANRSTS